MIDLMRSRDIFDPTKFKKDVHIIGVGATGSHLCENLVENGIPGDQIHVYDYDVIEEHNISNQLYTKKQIGKLKVEALKDIMLDSYDEEIIIHPEKVEDCSRMTGVIFLLIDGKREPLFKTIRMKSGIDFFIETGIDARAGTILSINPKSLKQVKYFEVNRASNEPEPNTTGERSVCGTRLVVNNTVKNIASLACWEFIHCVNDPKKVGRRLEIFFDPYDMIETIIP